MAGGLLNLVSGGVQNVIMFGNPQKTYWTSAYKQITNFGLQNFRLDYEGLRQLQLTSDTVYVFKVKRYADLLTNTIFTIQLPDIYSPIYGNQPYEFRWIKNIGAMMIRSIRFTIGGNLIQHMTGHDIVALANRDLTMTQKEKWDQMTGNLPDLYNPALGRGGFYPNATYQASGAEPSIRGRQLRIPLPIWWGLNSQQAFPLVALQYNELHLEITLRPIRELFQIRDITNLTGNPNNVIAPNMIIPEHQLSVFLQTPPQDGIYETINTSWNENTHLSCTYCFLSEEEAYIFATKQQSYLVRELYDTWFYSVSITDKVWLQNSCSLVLGWMMFFQRSDVAERNEWSNYTNWAYDYLPSNIQPTGTMDANNREIYVTGPYATENQKDILQRLGILFDGTYREESKPGTLYKYDYQYLSIPGQGQVSLDGMYCYNFCLNTSPFVLQPSGAVNLSKFSSIELELTTITPPLNPELNVLTLCDPFLGQSIGTSKNVATLYMYYYNMLVIEERFNVLSFVGGNAALMNAR